MKYRGIKETSLSFFPFAGTKSRVAEHSEVGEGILPLPVGEVAELCEVGEGKQTKLQDPLSHLR